MTMFSRKNNNHRAHPLALSVTDPQAPYLEAYRRLYRKILYLARQQADLKTLCITSSQVGEGKTLTAVNLSLVMAEDPTRRIALVDCDFRRPQVARYLGLRSGPGLAAVLSGRKELRDVVLRPADSRENLAVFPAGRLQEEVYPLLYKGKLEPLLAQLREDFDFIIIDSPPILPILDQGFLVDIVDGMLLVVKARSTPKDMVRAALETLETNKIIGVVFNGAEKQLSSYYSYTYGYDYNNKYYSAARKAGQV
jgi:succinoglycan biosynthesis transport protein ExoP